ncbi:tRNA (guanosine(37)-N1)-methyltransferase TrmD [Micrococcales bacterium 31B]|nr:tRNA (guanosine(37)-N1)-methyltransferase TrmD [Micrococcales bacterium 31B]
MRLDVFTIFPEYLQPLGLSLLGKAREEGLIALSVHDLREHAHDRHRTVDDAPLGGGAGMVMKPEPWGRALDAWVAKTQPGPAASAAGEAGEVAARPVLIVPSPAGARFDQEMAYELAALPALGFACGRYEGIDERVLDYAREDLGLDVRPVSIGDYVLNGGEVAVLAMIEAIVRLLPGVIGNAASLDEESHTGGLLEYPVYTRPAVWNRHSAPEVLLSGHHAKVARWRRDQQLLRTCARRPDLIEALDPQALDKADRAVLREQGFAIRDGRVVRSTGTDG